MKAFALSQEVPLVDAESGRRCLSVTLGPRSYAVPLDRILDLVPWPTVSALPPRAGTLPGVITHQGRPLPVVDLRPRLESYPPRPTNRACILILQVAAVCPGSSEVGVVADAVREWTEPSAAAESLPRPFAELGEQLKAAFRGGLPGMRGMARALLAVKSVSVGRLLITSSLGRPAD